MTSFRYQIQNQEENDSNISVTVTVNGVETAVVIRKATLIDAHGKPLKGKALATEIARRLAQQYKEPTEEASGGMTIDL